MARDPKLRLEALLTTAKIQFLVANYTEAENKLKEVLKLQPKHPEANYWNGLLLLYTYRTEATPKAMAAKAQQAESILLGFCAKL